MSDRYQALAAKEIEAFYAEDSAETRNAAIDKLASHIELAIRDWVEKNVL